MFETKTTAMNDASLHEAIISGFLDNQRPPTVGEIAERFESTEAQVRHALRTLADNHGVVLRGGPTNPDIWLSEISASMGDGNRLPRSRSNEKTPP